ncbi:Outer-membrane lipoprotein LolB precursor [Sodalis glossinidius str. 'morsitans']|uniref:Outer-membrane lipoprotein LolB n=2 Tax=Sodalis glossinidius (strain morsitans) TaxID=343509 RepID=LOLB_SODGM|nr:lipoprotein insertase outer membrane protein LolB [Sodalis glossinidius]Q2NRS2.1 RecName: Full=Outer-membrane lipoprotein LolB; Flags: Precursor [Sodalis glossinidius str. 'morsitans']BAE75153.1 lipoprotein LolB precursor [Sodalis glossinidius str. 'morsitans']CRL46112.1 Outer-membrane lipoprotein LolB precursor [Sodalis glossinidius str. 'morsitans']
MHERNYAVFRLLPLASLLLAACSVHTPSGPAKSQTSPEWRAHQQSLSALGRYQTRGAFAYLSSQQKVYALFNWQQTSADRYRLILTNPLGSTEMDLNVQPGVAQLVNNQGKRYVSDDPEVMIQKLAGMSIPLNDLRQWMLGLPGDATDFTLDSRGYLHTLNYSHNGQLWTVTYQGYHDDTVPALPSNLKLRQGDNRIKLKMDSWSL